MDVEKVEKQLSAATGTELAKKNNFEQLKQSEKMRLR